MGKTRLPYITSIITQIVTKKFELKYTIFKVICSVHICFYQKTVQDSPVENFLLCP